MYNEESSLIKYEYTYCKCERNGDTSRDYPLEMTLLGHTSLVNFIYPEDFIEFKSSRTSTSDRLDVLYQGQGQRSQLGHCSKHGFWL